MSSKKRKHEEKGEEGVSVDGVNVIFQLPRSSSKWQRSETPLWEKFGVELEDMHGDKTLKSVCICELKAILHEAAHSCGLPRRSPTDVVALIKTTLKPLRLRKSWCDMSGEERRTLMAAFDPEVVEKASDPLQRKALALLHGIVCRLANITNSTAGHVRKGTIQQNHTRESGFENFVASFLEEFFPKRIGRKDVQSAYLHSVDMSVNGQLATCDPDLLCTSFLNKYFLGLIALVVEVKHADTVPDQYENDLNVRNCWGTLNEHFSQLLVCVRDSLFSRHWESGQDPSRNVPESNMFSVFGAMVHGTKFQLTCLQVSKEHSTKICRRQPNLRFSESTKDRAIPEESIIADESAEGAHLVSWASEASQNTASLSEGEQPLVNELPTRPTSETDTKKRKSLTNEEPSRSPTSLAIAQQHGRLLVSRVVDLQDIFQDNNNFDKFLELLDFLDCLSQYASVNLS